MRDGEAPRRRAQYRRRDDLRDDARELARLAIADPAMLHPVSMRGEIFQRMLRLHHVRNLLVSQGTQKVIQIRGFAKSIGYRIGIVGTRPRAGCQFRADFGII